MHVFLLSTTDSKAMLIKIIRFILCASIFSNVKILQLPIFCSKLHNAINADVKGVAAHLPAVHYAGHGFLVKIYHLLIYVSNTFEKPLILVPKKK